MASPETDGCAVNPDPRANAKCAGQISGAGQATQAATENPYQKINRVMHAEIEAAAQHLRALIGRASFNCVSMEHDAIVKAQERLSEAEMWAKRAIGRS